MEIDNEALKWSNPYRFERVNTGNKPYDYFLSGYIENTSFKFELYEQFVPVGERTGVYSIEVVDTSNVRLYCDNGIQTTTPLHVASVARFIAEKGWNGHSIMQTVNARCKTWIDLELPKFIKEFGWNKKLVKQMENERIQYYENRKELIKKILREHSHDDVTCVFRDTNTGKVRSVKGELSLADLYLGYFEIKGHGNEKSTQFHINDVQFFETKGSQLRISMTD